MSSIQVRSDPTIFLPQDPPRSTALVYIPLVNQQLLVLRHLSLSTQTSSSIQAATFFRVTNIGKTIYKKTKN